MTNTQKGHIAALQQCGLGYKKIAAEVGLPANTIKTYCRRHPVASVAGHCAQCGAAFPPHPYQLQKRFCSEKCRMAWWKAHPESRKRNVLYTHTCEKCGHSFQSPSSTSKYCSRQCYADARRKGCK